MDILTRLLITLALIALGVGLYWTWNRWHVRRLTRGRAATLPGLETFHAGAPAILYFTTPDCAPCYTVQRPALERLAAEWAEGLNVIEIDASVHPELADYWGVLSIPTTFIIDPTGQPRRVNHGVTSAAKLKQQLEEISGGGRKNKSEGPVTPLPIPTIK
jgi:thioredoxin 1